MRSDLSFYRRQAAEEMAAASRSVTPEARLRHEDLFRLLVERLKFLSDASPCIDSGVEQRLQSEVKLAIRSAVFARRDDAKLPVGHRSFDANQDFATEVWDT